MGNLHGYAEWYRTFATFRTRLQGCKNSIADSSLLSVTDSCYSPEYVISRPEPRVFFGGGRGGFSVDGGDADQRGNSSGGAECLRVLAVAGQAGLARSRTWAL